MNKTDEKGDFQQRTVICKKESNENFRTEIKNAIEERNQDGGVERRALTPSCENIRITTSC